MSRKYPNNSCLHALAYVKVKHDSRMLVIYHRRVLEEIKPALQWWNLLLIHELISPLLMMQQSILSPHSRLAEIEMLLCTRLNENSIDSSSIMLERLRKCTRTEESKMNVEKRSWGKRSEISLTNSPETKHNCAAADGKTSYENRRAEWVMCQVISSWRRLTAEWRKIVNFSTLVNRRRA